MSSKREREIARRRAAKWQARRAAAEARARRNRRIAGAVLGVAVLVGVVLIVVAVVRTLAPTTPADASPVLPPDPSLAEGRTWTATFATSVGDVEVELDGAAAPQAVAAIVDQARSGLLDGATCYRLTVTDPMFVLQCGALAGGPEYRFGPVENDPADGVYPAGTVAMARVAGDAYSMGGQVFVVYADSTIPADAAGGYTVIGSVTEGLDLLQQVAEEGVQDGTTETPVTQVTIEKVDVQ
ncbi:MAG TPA: peptidylprolyl isomerase [Actinotalea sp.]|nr:peptidylprolyl isomerase [Actinotalea sp.]